MSDAPLEPRRGHAAVWTGTHLIVWGGQSVDGSKDPTLDFADGAAYDPKANRWTTLPAGPLEAVFDAQAVWTGKEVIFWGGTQRAGEVMVHGGAAYDPRKQSWRSLKNPPPRAERTVVWSGTEIIIAESDRTIAWDPETERTRTLPRVPLKEGARYAVGLWSGTELIVWGGDLPPKTAGEAPAGYLNDGWALDPAIGIWRHVPAAPIAGRGDDTASVWTGSRMIVWDGQAGSVSDGAAYDPTADRWHKIADAPLRPRDSANSAAWAGTEMITWFSTDDGQGIGLAYDVTKDAWRRLPQSPLAPADSSIWWTGDRLIVWNPAPQGPQGFGSPPAGALYDPAAP